MTRIVVARPDPRSDSRVVYCDGVLVFIGSAAEVEAFLRPSGRRS